MPTPSAHPRRWWSVSLRGLMVLVLAVGGLLGWAAAKIRTQRAAVAAIRAAGGVVQFDWGMKAIGTTVGPNGPRPIRRREPDAPRWLRSVLGDELFQFVRLVDLKKPISPEVVLALAEFDRLETLTITPSSPVLVDLSPLHRLRHLDHIQIHALAATDSALKGIAGIDSLRSFMIYPWGGPGRPSPATDAGLVALARLPNLESLDIWHCPNLTDGGAARLVVGLPRLTGLAFRSSLASVREMMPALIEHHPDLTGLSLDGDAATDDDLRQIVLLRHLRKLSLQNHKKITPAGLAHLQSLPELTMLFVNSRTLDDHALVPLAAMPLLEEVFLSGAQITDAGLARLAPLVNLRTLGLAGTKVTDTGLPMLARLPNLVDLSLVNLPITDAGLMALAPLTHLERLDLTGTRITPAGVAALRKAIPSLTRVTSRSLLATPANPMPAAPPS